MSRAPQSFTQSDLTKALKAAQKAGVQVQIEVDLATRKLVIIPIQGQHPGVDTNIDMATKQWEARK